MQLSLTPLLLTTFLGCCCEFSQTTPAMPVAHHTRSMAAPVLPRRSGRSATPARHLSLSLARSSRSRRSVRRHQHHSHGLLSRAMSHVAAVVGEDMSPGVALRSPQLSGSAAAAQGRSRSVQPSGPSDHPGVPVPRDSRVGGVIGPNPEEASSPARSIHNVNIQHLAEDDEVEDPELLAPPVPRLLRLNPLPAVAGELVHRDLDANPPLPVADGAPQLDEHLADDGQVFRQGGEVLQPNVHHQAFAEDTVDDESSESSYDSIYSVMHLSMDTPEGRRAWKNYNLTSRYVNRLPPYFHE